MADVGSGDRIGQYVLCREIGKGAMATVYEAEHVDLGKRVALKRMHPHLAADATAASRFLREGKAATQIRSRHVVDVFDVGTHEGVPYMVMELLDGVDLAAHLRERRKLSLEEIADLAIPVAVAVHAAHEAGVIHRDLKPSNVFLAKKDGGGVSPVILDFGISKLTAEVDRDLTASEVLLGTVHYMSPEQTRGGRKASAHSDQYALGVLLYECATGIKPFAGSTPYAVMHAIVSARVSPPSALDAALPAAFDAVVMRAMHRDLPKRFENVRALGVALLPWAGVTTRDRYAAELGVDASAIRGPASRRRPWRAVLAVGAGLTLVVLAGARLLPGPAEHTAAARPTPRGDLTATAIATTPAPAPAPAPATTPATATAAATASAPESAPAPAPASATAPTHSPPRTPPPRASTAPSTAPPERGTNGALIVE
jgi:serine/threonine-protein kinase